MRLKFKFRNCAELLQLTSTVYGEVRRASREAIIAPHSLYTLMCVVSCGVHVDSNKYTKKKGGVINSGRWYEISRRERLENAFLRAAGNFIPSVLCMVSCVFKQLI